MSKKNKIIDDFFIKIKNNLLIKNQYYELKSFFLNMISNLTELNSINYYKDFPKHYNLILKNIEELKLYIDKIENNINNIKPYKIEIIKKKIIECSNYVCNNNLLLVLKLIEPIWLKYFNQDDINKLYFFNDFIKPICFWDSNIHVENNKIPLSPSKGKLIFISNSNSNSNSNFLKNMLIGSLLGINNSSQTPNKESEPIIEETDDTEQPVKNNFDIKHCEELLGTNLIHIDKNKKSISLLDNKYGCSIYLNFFNRYIVIQGIFKDDLFNLSLNYEWSKKIILKHKSIINNELLNIPEIFKNNFYDVMNLRDKIILESKEIIEEIKKKYNDFKHIQGKPLMLLINEFLLGSKFRKIDILTLFFMSNEDDQKLAFMLFDIFKSKDKKNISTEIYYALHHTIRKKLDITKLKIEADEKEIMTITESEIPYEKRIMLLQAKQDVKNKAIEKLKQMKNNFQGDSKAQMWLDGLLKIPFGVYNENEIISFKKKFIQSLNCDVKSDTQIENYIKNNQNLCDKWNQYKIDKKNYLFKIRKTLDECVYGHKEAKTQLERIFAQWINGEMNGAVLGLQGPPGTGKTSLAKNGLSKCLTDSNGNARPFAFLPIGGSVNGSTLVGHSYTYVGSTWGRIVDILISTKCMNPIIFIDELDKVSATENGREIISILTHLTDSTQNDEFEDKFFSGIKLDLSKALIVFSFNDPNLIDPILKDRITIIPTEPLKLAEKITIIQDYMLPEILNDVGFDKNEIIFDDNLIKYLIETYTLEAGVRKIKEKMVEIVREINLKRFYSEDSVKLPYIVTKDFCIELFENKPKIRVKQIISKPTIGIINGLYANSAGLGGITLIQAIKFPSEKAMDLQLTGALGDVMKESVHYALKLAFSLVPKKKQTEILKKPFGIHLHCPEGAVKKDGPSAGTAITVVLYSLLAEIPISNEVALTGEIDLVGNVTAIGGLHSKLNGAKNAGVKLALYPSENQEDIDIMRKENNSPEDDTFKIKPISRIEDVLDICLVKTKTTKKKNKNKIE